MLRLRKTSAAEQDLLGIWEYIARDNPTAADRFWNRLSERMQALLQQPFMGESQDRFRPGLRSIVEGSYIIFYESRPDEILIYRVLHGARRWEELLTGSQP
jgi:toxin ParE1/3/4